MNKFEYMSALREALQNVDEDIALEIIEDYENHFSEGAAFGKTEEDVVKELGSIEELVQELKEFQRNAAIKPTVTAVTAESEAVKPTVTAVTAGSEAVKPTVTAESEAVKPTVTAGSEAVKPTVTAESEAVKPDETVTEAKAAPETEEQAEAESEVKDAEFKEADNDASDEEASENNRFRFDKHDFSYYTDNMQEFTSDLNRVAAEMGTRAAELVKKLGSTFGSMMESFGIHDDDEKSTGKASGTDFNTDTSNTDTSNTGTSNTGTSNTEAFNSAASDAKASNAGASDEKTSNAGTSDEKASSDSKTTSEAPVNESFTSADVENLFVDADFGDVILEESDDSLFHVEYRSNATPAQQLTCRFEFSRNDDTATVRVKRLDGVSNFFRHLSLPRLELKLMIPSDFGKISIKALAGNITLEDISCSTLNVDATAGTVKLRDCVIGAETIQAVAGNVSIKDNDAVTVTCKVSAGNLKIDGSAATVEASSNAGNVYISGCGYESILATSSAGNVHIDLEDVPGYTADVKCSLGNIKLEYDENRFMPKGSGTYTMGIIKDGACTISAKSSVGNVTIKA